VAGAVAGPGRGLHGAARGVDATGDDARWARATFDDTGPLIVYTTFDQDRRPASLHVDRRAR